MRYLVVFVPLAPGTVDVAHTKGRYYEDPASPAGSPFLKPLSQTMDP